MVFLKIPIVALFLIVRWAVRQTPEAATGRGRRDRPAAAPLHPHHPRRACRARRAGARTASPAPAVAAARAHRSRRARRACRALSARSAARLGGDAGRAVWPHNRGSSDPNRVDRRSR